MSAHALVLVLTFVSGPPAAPRLDVHGNPLPIHAIARLGRGRLQHVLFPLNLAFSPDGKTLASSGMGVRLWSVPDGRLLRSIYSEGWAARVIRTDRGLLAARATDGTVWYDVATGKDVGSIPRPPRMLSAASLDPKSGQMRTWGPEDGVVLWDLSAGKQVDVIKSRFAYTAALSRDGTTLLTSDSKGAVTKGWIRFWEVKTRKLIREFPAGRAVAFALALSDDGKTLAVGHVRVPRTDVDEADDKETAVTLRDAVTGKELHLLSKGGAPTRSLAFSADGTMVAVGRADSPYGSIELYDVKTGKRLDPPGDRMGAFVAAVFRRPGRELVTVGVDDTVRVWAEDGKPLAQTRLPGPGLRTFALSPDGTRAAWVAPDGKLKALDLRTGKELPPIGIKEPYGSLLSFRVDGKVLAVRKSDPTGSSVQLWDFTASKGVKVMSTKGLQGSAVAFSPDGRRVAAGGYGKPITLYDAASGAALQTFGERTTEVADLLYSPDGRTLVTRHFDQTITSWDVASGKQSGVRIHHPSPIKDAGVLTRMALSPDGSLLATGGLGADRTVRLWDVVTGKERARLHGHADSILSLAFSADGKRLVSGSGDATALVWDVIDALAGR